MARLYKLRAGEAGLVPEPAETQYGVHMDLHWFGSPASRAPLLSRAQQVGAQVSRNSLLWHLVEPTQGTRTWTNLDNVMDEIEAAGLTPVFAFYGSPQWANGDADYLVVPQGGSQATYDLWVSRYADFIGETVARYASQCAHWELWNEQNEHHFWKPAPSVTRYVQFYNACFAAAKAANPAAQVAFGGLAGLNASCCIAGKDFLNQCYDAGVVPEAIAIHPYSGQNQAPDNTIPFENSFTDIELIHNITVTRGVGDTPLWATEWGWPTSVVSEATQANYVEQSLEMIRDLYQPYLQIASYFLIQDTGGYTYGLFRSDGTARPSATRFTDFMAAL